MKPPAPNPVSGLSAAKEASTAQTAASTALPPSRRTEAPASAVSGWPAAMTPFMCGSVEPAGAGLAGEELGHVDAELASERPRPRRAGRPSLVRVIVGSTVRRGGAARPSKRVATTVTQTWSLSSSSTFAPKMMLASGWAASPTTLAASLTSTSERSDAAGDREQDRAGALHRGLEQRRGDRFFGGEDRAALAGAHADPEQRPAGLGHDRPHVGEVEVDQRPAG